MNKNTY